MKPKIKFDKKAFENKIKKAAQEAIDETVKEDVIPKVKNALSQKASTSLARLTPNSGVKLSSEEDAVRKYGDTKKGIRRNLSSEAYIKNSDLKQSGNKWSFVVFYDIPSSDPLWDWHNGDVGSVSDNGELFAQWIVDGKLVIHPALSQYRGQILNGSKYENPYFGAVESGYTWQRYVQNYTFQQVPFVDSVIKDLNKKEFRNDINSGISKRLNKKLKK